MTPIHDRSFFAGRRPRIMAHRGAAGEAPENTIPSFELAIDQDADILEMDVHLTADGHVVVCHDPTVDRMTNGSGRVSGYTLADLQRLDAGYRFTADGGKTFPFRGRGIQIPTLEKVLSSFPDIPFNIEIKAHDGRLVRNTCDVLNAFGRIEQRSVVLAAFNHPLMELIRRHGGPHVQTSFSVGEIRNFLFKAWLRFTRFNSTGTVFQVPVSKGIIPIVNRRFVAASHALGFEVHPWTIDDPRQMRKLLDMGVDGLFTNYPARARQVLVERGLR